MEAGAVVGITRLMILTGCGANNVKVIATEYVKAIQILNVGEGNPPGVSVTTVSMCTEIPAKNILVK